MEKSLFGFRWGVPDPDLEVIQRDEPLLSVSDPALAEYLNIGSGSLAGTSVTPTSALGLSAVWRAVSLIAGTVAGLPLKSYRTVGDNERERIKTFLDSAPHPDMTPFEFVELVVTHLLLWGNAYLLHIKNGAGAIAGLKPIPPSIVLVEPDESLGKRFKISINGEMREFTPFDLTHVPGLGYDGLKGLSVISAARQSLGTSLAGEQAAAKMYGSGLMLGGTISPKEELTREQSDAIKQGLKDRSGVKNAGDLAYIPALVEFNRWTQTAEDAQFIESRRFGVTEVARLFGVPKHLLAEDGASMWGAGISEMNRAMARFTFSPWTNRIEQRLTRLLPRPQLVEFDFRGLIQPNPAEEITLLIQQVQAGLLTRTEARRIMNLPAMTPAQEAEVSEAAQAAQEPQEAAV
jgi:HK97 family phage portal protein